MLKTPGSKDSIRPLCLVVESDPDERQALVRYLHGAGVLCVPEATLSDALNALHDTLSLGMTFDGLLSGEHLQDGTWTSVCAAFKYAFPSRPYALLRSHKYPAEPLPEGVVAFTRPFDRVAMRLWLWQRVMRRKRPAEPVLAPRSLADSKLRPRLRSTPPRPAQQP